MRSPSQPSPFSAELQSFIITKFDPLLTIVRELNDKLHEAERDRFRFEKRIATLEKHIQLIQQGQLSNLEAPDEALESKDSRLTLVGDEVSQAPWLFSCQLGTPTASLQVLLEFTPDTTEELDVRQWNGEEDMWISFLEELPAGVSVLRSTNVDLRSLRATARTALLELCKAELLLILRQVPGKEKAVHQKQWITLVAIIAAALSEAWARVERTEPALLGRIALVLEGDGIGTRLRAGRHKFVVEPLN